MTIGFFCLSIINFFSDFCRKAIISKCINIDGPFQYAPLHGQIHNLFESRFVNIQMPVINHVQVGSQALDYGCLIVFGDMFSDHFRDLEYGISPFLTGIFNIKPRLVDIIDYLLQRLLLVLDGVVRGNGNTLDIKYARNRGQLFILSIV